MASKRKISFNVRVKEQELIEFKEACYKEDITASLALRTMMRGFVKKHNEKIDKDIEMSSKYTTPHEQHKNRRALAERLSNATAPTIVLVGGHGYTADHYGTVSKGDDSFVIAIKGKTYDIAFGMDSTVIFTKPHTSSDVD